MTFKLPKIDYLPQFSVRSVVLRFKQWMQRITELSYRTLVKKITLCLTKNFLRSKRLNNSFKSQTNLNSRSTISKLIKSSLARAYVRNLAVKIIFSNQRGASIYFKVRSFRQILTCCNTVKCLIQNRRKPAQAMVFLRIASHNSNTRETLLLKQC